MVVSYKKPNSITKIDRYPMPSIDDILHGLNGAKYFSKIDLFSGYFQIKMCPCCVEKTAFITPIGLFQYKYMSFGFVNAPGEFNRVMRIVLGELIGTICLQYMDDIIVYSSDFPSHIERLDKVLSTLNKHNLTIKPSKCLFAAARVELLGHVVSGEGIHCDESKLKAIQHLPAPRNIKDVRSVLGMSGYYRSFIKNYANLTGPLTELLQKDRKFHWTKKHAECFQQLKEAMATPPVLAHFDPNLAIEIHTDASLLGSGGCLFQLHGRKRKPIAFASRKLTPAERNYSITELECLAVIYCAQKFRDFIFEQPFRIVTDHHALRALKLCKNPANARLARWQLKLQGLKYDIVYQKGTSHVVADCLSRLPVDFPSAKDEDQLEIPAYGIRVVANNERETLIDHYSRDPRIRNIMGSDPLPNNYKLEDDLLYYDDGKGKRLELPETLYVDYIKEFHEPPVMAHLGVLKVFKKMKERFHFPDMRGWIEKVIKSCQVCQMRKPSPHGPLGKTLNVYTKNMQVMDLVSIDVMGPLPRTSLSGTKYIITAIEYVTRFVTAKAIRNVTAATCARFMITEVVSKLGVPKSVLSDNASTFRSRFFQLVNRHLGTKNVYSSPYHSQGNALVERQHRTIQDILSKYVQSNQKDWDIHLPLAIFAINTSVQQSTKYSPFELLFGRKPNLPVDAMLDLTLNTDTIPVPVAKLQAIRTEASDNLARAQEAQKVIHDKNRKDITFEVGDKVFIYTPIQKPERSRKLTLQWRGPYIITEKRSALNYIVKPVFPHK